MRQFFTVLVLSLIFTADLFSDDIKMPMLPRKGLAIPDGEYLIYDVIQRGEKVAEASFVTRYIASNIIRVYYTGVFLINHSYIGMAGYTNHYTNYFTQYTIDLTTGSMTDLDYESTEFDISNKLKEPVAMSYRFGTNTQFNIKTYDGYEVHEQKFLFKNIDTRLPSWDQFELQYGVRIMDVNQQGYFNQFIYMLKAPIVVSMKKLKDETVQTPTGKYETEKIMYGLGTNPGFGDRVLMNLFKSYIDSFNYYIEKSPRKLLVKYEDRMNDNYWILSKDSIWK
jgi:hypothetical protein